VTKAARALLEDTEPLFTSEGLPEAPTPVVPPPAPPDILPAAPEPSFLFQAPPTPARKTRAKPKPAKVEPETLAEAASESADDV
jgi:hypothetical protein